MTYASVNARLQEAIQQGGYETLEEAFYHFRDKNGNQLKTDDGPLTEEEKKFKTGIRMRDPSGEGYTTLLHGEDYEFEKGYMLSYLRPLKAIIEQYDGELTLEGSDGKQFLMKNVMGGITTREMDDAEIEQQRQNRAEAQPAGPESSEESDPPEVPVSAETLLAAQEIFDEYAVRAGYASLEEAFSHFRDADGKPFKRRDHSDNEAEAEFNERIIDTDGSHVEKGSPLYEDAKDEYLSTLRPLLNAPHSDTGDHEISLTDKDGKSHSIRQFMGQYVSDYTPQRTAEDVVGEEPLRTDAEYLRADRFAGGLAAQGVLEKPDQAEVYVLSDNGDGTVGKASLHETIERLADDNYGSDRKERSGRRSTRSSASSAFSPGTIIRAAFPALARTRTTPARSAPTRWRESPRRRQRRPPAGRSRCTSSFPSCFATRSGTTSRRFRRTRPKARFRAGPAISTRAISGRRPKGKRPKRTKGSGGGSRSRR